MDLDLIGLVKEQANSNDAEGKMFLQTSEGSVSALPEVAPALPDAMTPQFPVATGFNKPSQDQQGEYADSDVAVSLPNSVQEEADAILSESFGDDDDDDW